ncbi:MAG TPA: ubiquinol-cytochrome c reductase iron-sulfur subunit [Polyangia bacterium]|nr:ubiquinol-cytochrome c reductase iron-sulfur subunit [Polyangia bacterium]
MAVEPPDERRAFLKVITAGLGALTAALAIVPGLGFLAGPARRGAGASGPGPLRVAGERDVKPGKPLRVTAVGPREDAWLRLDHVTLGSCWLVRAVEDGPIKAFSTVCPHLGCGVDFDEKTGKFNCPCHTSAFDLDGRCLGGPSPRGLDQLETHVEGRDVLVRYQRFRVGTAKREPIG